MSDCRHGAWAINRNDGVTRKGNYNRNSSPTYTHLYMHMYYVCMYIFKMSFVCNSLFSSTIFFLKIPIFFLNRMKKKLEFFFCFSKKFLTFFQKKKNFLHNFFFRLKMFWNVCSINVMVGSFWVKRGGGPQIVN